MTMPAILPAYTGDHSRKVAGSYVHSVLCPLTKSVQ